MASTVVELLRRRMIGKQDDYLKGWTKGMAIGWGGSVINDDRFICSPFFPKTSDTAIRITIHIPKVAERNTYLGVYDANFGYIKVASTDLTTTTDKNFYSTISSNAAYYRLALPLDGIDESFIKDTLTGDFIFKGKNVE